MPSTGRPPSSRSGSTCGAPGSYTDAGPPERITPFTFRSARSARRVACGRTSQYTRHSRTRRAMSWAYCEPRSSTAISSLPMSVLRGPREREATQTDRGHAAEPRVEAIGEAVDALQRQVAVDAERGPEGLVVGLGEAEVPDRMRDLAVLDEERTIPRHARDDRPQRMDPPRVPEPRHQDAAPHAADEL